MKLSKLATGIWKYRRTLIKLRKNGLVRFLINRLIFNAIRKRVFPKWSKARTLRAQTVSSRS